MDKYYYSDAVYELELNLLNVRRELISMLEVFEETNCSDCFQIKCNCVKEPKTTSKTSVSGSSHSSKKELDDLEKEAPEQDPPKAEDESAGPSTPKKEEKDSVIKNIEAWIEASSKAVDEEVKPVAIDLKESFLEVCEDKKDIEKKNLVTHANAVEAFFKYFKVPPTSTNVTYVSAKLAAACSNNSERSYSYF